MKLTQAKQVKEIVRPSVGGLADAPVVSMSDPIMHAVELMLKNDKMEIAVVGRCGVIGCIRLEDALRSLGLLSHAT